MIAEERRRIIGLALEAGFTAAAEFETKDLNFRQLDWVEHREWVYEHRFTAPEAKEGRRFLLEFEGLDVSKRLFLPEDFLDGKGHILVTPLSELVDKAFGKKEEA